MSALLIPVIVYGTVVASAKLAVFSVTVSVLPSLTLAALPDNAYVGVILVSLIATVILSLTPFRVIVNVSAPSVSASLAKVNIADAVFDAIVKLPVKLAPLISAVVTPVIVYGTFIASAIFAVVSVIVNDCPSLNAAPLLDNEYVAAAA